jgi:deoxyribodipyrimidine photolyase
MATKPSRLPRCVVWFRLGLRVHDNDALLKAISMKPEKIYPVFTIDPHYAVRARVGIRRWIFLLECLKDLDRSLRSMGSRLIVLRGDPLELFPPLFNEWKITHLHLMHEGWDIIDPAMVTLGHPCKHCILCYLGNRF